jgi:hypothetical protein
MKTSHVRFASPGARMAGESNATKRESAESAGPRLWRSRSVPSEARLTRTVVLVARSRMKTSRASLVSLGTRFEARELKAMKRPSAKGTFGAHLRLHHSPPTRSS